MILILFIKKFQVVISGIAGRFPNSANITEFASNLYNKVDMVDDARKYDTWFITSKKNLKIFWAKYFICWLILRIFV